MKALRLQLRLPLRRRVAPLLLAALAGAACRQDMHDQPYYEVLEAGPFFADGRASRPAVAGTVARGRLNEDEHLFTGRVDGEPAAEFPFEMTRAVLERGRQRYGIYCAPCHAYDGSGDGMIVRRGLRRPTSFHDPRLIEAPPGYFFDVITNGYGVMYDYSARVAPEDRWAIVGWIRVLQRSRRGAPEDLTPAEREALR